MRTMRKRLVSVALLTLGVGFAPSASAQLLMKGSDTLEDVARDAITACGVGGATGITYVGGGSTGGQGALTTSAQQIAPMSRELNGSACTTLGATIGQELIGLDGLVLIAANQTGGDSQGDTQATTDDCSDNITGGITMAVAGCTTAQGCDASGNYTFTDWKDVLAVVYGGQDHGSQTQLMPSGALCGNATDPACVAPEVCVGTPTATNNTARCGILADRFQRNPNRIDCNGAIRRTLVNTWGNLFRDVSPTSSCRTGGCLKLKHAFRRDDLSGTTDTFVTLVGMLGIPAYTSAMTPDSTLPAPDSVARPNPFCNAGSALMNKGDSDYLDLDPIRRAVDHNALDTTNRPGLELVGQASLPALGGSNNDANCEPADGDSTIAGVQPKLPPTESAISTEPGVLPSPVIADSENKLLQELGFNLPSVSGGSAIVKPTSRQCLGLVVSVAVPGNYTESDAFFGANAAAATPPVPCSVNAGTSAVEMRFVISDTQHSSTALCPDGKHQPCRLPVSLATGSNNFNCYIQNTNPTILPIRDNRAYNLHPVQANGQYKRDNYTNPNLPTLNAGRQNRVVSAFYRLHFLRGTNIGGSVPTLAAAEPYCRKMSATNQIGCLVKASSCSIGFAGREAVDELAVGDNFAFRINAIAPSRTNIENLVTTATRTDDYPISRGLWVNAIKDFSTVGGIEGTLLGCFRTPGTIDTIISNRNFIPVPAGVTRSRGCPSGL